MSSVPEDVFMLAIEDWVSCQAMFGWRSNIHIGAGAPVARCLIYCSRNVFITCTMKRSPY